MVNYSKIYKKLINWLYIHHNVAVYEANTADCDGYYNFDTNKKYANITVNKKVDLKSKIFIILHEAGHHILNQESKTKVNLRFSGLCHSRLMRKKSDTVSLLREEILAWEKGYEISQQLKLYIPWRDYEKEMIKQYWTYIKYISMHWFGGKKNYSRS